MAQELVQYSIPDIEKIAIAVASSNLFGIKTKEQAMALLLLAQAEGRHPVEAARDYNIIQGKPSKTAEAMLRDFLSQGGKVEWHELTNERADATFSHPSGGSVRLDWDMTRAKAAGIGSKDMWSKYPRPLLRARLISEGVRSVFPSATSGMYVPEEVNDLEEKPIKDVTPVSIDESLESLKQAAKDAAAGGEVALDVYLKALPKDELKKLVPFGQEIRSIAIEVDSINQKGEAA